ncbi:MAG: Crp/Fnr family transcriptional regulator [Acetobacteraceae bacterium]
MSADARPQDAADARLEVLARNPLFGRLPAEEIARLAAYAHVRPMRRGETLFRRGDPGLGLIAVLAGKVRIVLPSDEGKDIVLNTVRAGEVLGEIALLDGRPRSADAVALTDGRVMTLDRREVLPLLESHPKLALAVIEVLCERLRRTSTQVEELMFLPLEVRLARALLRMAAAQKLASVPATQKELAELAGATRESVNRLLKAWEAEGTVSLIPGRVTIRNEPALRAVAQETRG